MTSETRPVDRWTVADRSPGGHCERDGTESRLRLRPSSRLAALTMSDHESLSGGHSRDTARLLNISVSADLLRRWREWFAPHVQPFRVDLMSPGLAELLPSSTVEPTPEWIDTFAMYSGTWTWLDEPQFMALRPHHRRSLLAVRRRSVRPKLPPAWPSELAAAGNQLLLDWIASGTVRPSRHAEVPADIWNRAASLLPEARRLAGTFPEVGSGPNCFGTVLAAAGVPDTEHRPVGPDELEGWLDRAAEPIEGTAYDADPGVVFRWTEHGQTAHACVTIGEGWMLTKPSQSWSSPRIIRTVREVVNSWRYPTTRLFRHRLR